MTKIEKVWAREVLDSRGNPTVEAVVTVGGHEISAIAPSGASTGMYEALELRDGGNRYKGKGVLKAVENVRGPIAQAIVGMDPEDQKGIDAAIIAADGTDNKSRFGGNATTAVSFAVARAGAFAAGEELYEHIGKDHRTLPVPMFNIINGGKHAGGDLKIQECMIIPAGAESFSECLRMAAETYASLKSILKKRYGAGAINVGDEGGFAPPVNTVSEALGTIVDAISDAGYVPGKDIYLGIDAASSEFYDSGKYSVDGLSLTARELADHYREIISEYPLISIEDPFEENDFATTAELTKAVGNQHPQAQQGDLRGGRERAPAQGQPDRHRHRGAERPRDVRRPRVQRHRLPQVGRVRGHHHRRPLRRMGHRADQDGRALPRREDRQVQPPPQDRGQARRQSGLRRQEGPPALNRRRRTRVPAGPPGPEGPLFLLFIFFYPFTRRI